ISRGVERAVFIDSDRKAIDTIRENVKAAKIEDAAEIYRNEAMTALKVLAKRGRSFDLVFLDPPYRMKDVPEYLNYMQEHGMLKEGATAVAEHDASLVYPERIGGLVLRRRAEYGDTALSIYRFEIADREETVGEQ